MNLQDAVRSGEKDKSIATDRKKPQYLVVCIILWEEFTNQETGKKSKYCQPGVWYVGTVVGKLISR